MAELEKELGLALVEQVDSSSPSTPSSPRPRSVEAPQDEIKSRERTETTGSRPEELRDASRHGTPAQGLEEWEQRETRMVVEKLGRRELWEEELVGEAGGVAMQQQEELAGQEEELGRPAMGDQQSLVAVDDTDDTDDRTTLRTRKPPRLCQPRNLRSTSTVFDFVGYAPGSLLDARQRQPSTESYRVNI